MKDLPITMAKSYEKDRVYEHSRLDLLGFHFAMILK